MALGAGLWLLGSCAVDVENDEEREERALEVVSAPVVGAPLVDAEDVASAKELWRPQEIARCGLVAGGIDLVSVRAGADWVYFEIRSEATSSDNGLKQEVVVPKAELSTYPYATKHTPEGLAVALTPGSTSWIGITKAALGAGLQGPGQVEVSLSGWGDEVTTRLSVSGSGEWAYVPLGDREDVQIDDQGVALLPTSGLNVVVGP